MQIGRVAALGLLSTAGCTASWNAVVRYSPTPAVPGVSVEAAVYAAILRDYAVDWHAPVMTVSESGGEPEFAFAATRTGRGVIPSHWTDSLKREVAVALADTALRTRAPFDSLRMAAHYTGYGVRLLPASGAKRLDDPEHRIPEIAVSRPGFNADSTLAAVYISFWCGPLCGHGVMLLLARQPGYQWHTWHGSLSWIS